MRSWTDRDSREWLVCDDDCPYGIPRLPHMHMLRSDGTIGIIVRFPRQ